MKIKSSFLLFLATFFILGVDVVSAATLQFESSTSSLKIGENARLRVSLDPEGSEIVGVDAILKFNPQVIEVRSISSLGVFSQEIKKIVDNAKGELKYALANNYGVYLTDKADIFELEIIGKKPTSSTIIYFEYKQNSTNDTNIVAKGGRDVLIDALPLSLSIFETISKTSSETSSSDSISTPGQEVEEKDLGLGTATETNNTTFLEISKEKKKETDSKSQILGDTNKIENKDQKAGISTTRETNQNNKTYLIYALTLLTGLVLGYIIHMFVTKVRREKNFVDLKYP